jgi:hypothetical protein
MQVAAKYHGIGVVWEHRYYGQSLPFVTTPNVSSESRWDIYQLDVWTETQLCRKLYGRPMEVSHRRSGMSGFLSISDASLITRHIFIGTGGCRRVRKQLHPSFGQSSCQPSVVRGRAAGLEDALDLYRRIVSRCASSYASRTQPGDNLRVVGILRASSGSGEHGELL